MGGIKGDTKSLDNGSYEFVVSDELGAVSLFNSSRAQCWTLFNLWGPRALTP